MGDGLRAWSDSGALARAPVVVVFVAVPVVESPVIATPGAQKVTDDTIA
ncbi:hypothetical protein LO762_07565 [Actinocorallia sp. API 0066]|nr:hypothetical protein [Actinocorallia sp. API 0066]MCD0449046.1 hypothetical protein [Actinocorallia sp. API 0066]